MTIDRRFLLKGATLGLGALAVPGFAQAIAATGFTHDVASGEPGQDGVMLWTRYVPGAGGSGSLRWEVASDVDFARVVASGGAEAGPERDWCVKPVVRGLAPGAWYFYRFVDRSGSRSPVGRTRTLPDGSTDNFKLGVFSCSNLPFGYFNAYGHAAARRDIDLTVHLGDYYYEYQRGFYPSPEQAVADRLILPETEAFAVADYRLRYASYRADPDLRRLHRMFPMIMMWDDHESANNSWRDGAQNHQPETDGNWEVRKSAAMQACREWLPVSDSDWTSYLVGELAELFRPETRLTGRDRQLDAALVALESSDRSRALREFRDGPWQDPARTMLGAAQERWLTDGLRSSAAGGTKWQVLCQQVIMGARYNSPEIAAFLGTPQSDAARLRTELALSVAEAGLPMNLDTWDGYPAARTRLLGAAQDANASLIVLSGDSHNAWAFDLDNGNEPAGVEFAGQSVSSPGIEGSIPGDPAAVARAFVAASRQLRWVDTSRRGYMTLELTPDRATGEFVFMDTVQRPSLALSGRQAMSVIRGSNRISA